MGLGFRVGVGVGVRGFPLTGKGRLGLSEVALGVERLGPGAEVHLGGEMGKRIAEVHLGGRGSLNGSGWKGPQRSASSSPQNGNPDKNLLVKELY